jgi:type II secretory pathway component PulM
MTILLQLDPPAAEALRNEADGLGVSVEELAADIVRRHTTAKSAAIPDAKFRAVLADSLRDNEELLRRLAK